MQTTFAKDVTVDGLQDKFGLEQTEDQSQFREWQDDLPEISEAERQALNRIESNFKNLNRDPSMLEEAVKMAVLSIRFSRFLSATFQTIDRTINRNFCRGRRHSL